MLLSTDIVFGPYGWQLNFCPDFRCFIFVSFDSVVCNALMNYLVFPAAYRVQAVGFIAYVRPL
jgi:hypothetical protein